MSVQKRFARDLCIPVVLMCLEIFSKRTEVNCEIIPTRRNNCVFLRNGFTLHVSGDNSSHHQEYNAVYGLSGRQVHCNLTKTAITIIFYTTANMQSQVDHINPTYYPGGDGIVGKSMYYVYNFFCHLADTLYTVCIA